MDDISHDDGISNVVQIVFKISVNTAGIGYLEVLYFKCSSWILSVPWHFAFLKDYSESFISSLESASVFISISSGGKTWGNVYG